MKKVFLLALVVLFFGSVFGTETISSLTTNSPVPIDQTLTITGKYVRTDVNQIIYCKFVTFDANSGKVIDRLTDEEIFTDGTFYAEQKLAEPPYYRTSVYTVRAYCGNINEDVNFTVAQREGLENFFFGEFFYYQEHGFFYVYALIVLVVVVILLGFLWTPIKQNLLGAK
jgi:hypothetical protein